MVEQRPDGEIAYLKGEPNEWLAVDTSEPGWREEARERLEALRKLQRWAQGYNR